MQIRRPLKKDIADINLLLDRYELATITEAQLNSRDISLVVDDCETIVGFIWVGLMSKNTLGYVDHYCIDEAYGGKGLGHKLAIKALKVAKKKGVRRVSGIIRPTQWHDKSAINALKMAMASYPYQVTYVYADIQNSAKELGV